MDEEESMKCNKSLCQGAALLLIAITVLLAPGAGAQSKYKTLYKFKNGKDGSSVVAGLTFDQKGNLYGAARLGGAGGNGTVFKLTPKADGSWTESVLYSFCSLSKCADGAVPSASLIFDETGNLYGTAFLGGAHDFGAVFKLTPNADGSWTESVLHTFAGGTDGAYPYANLIFDRTGNLYGTTYGGADDLGTVFKLTPNSDGSWTESVIYNFTGGTDGAWPYASLIFDQTGNLYGATSEGGDRSSCVNDNCGVVFELMPNANGTWTESVLYRFGGKHGEWPYGGLIFDQAGNLYGTTEFGGNLSQCLYGCGVVFELTRQKDGSWAESVLYSFSGRDGRYPLAGLIFDAAGNLYGTTVLGGDHSLCGGSSCGVVFKLVPNSNGKWIETVLHPFLDRPGVGPYAGLIFDASGNLYGTTVGDGTSTFGSVFEITP
jgi:uncharacterized repeat protein (TIGR03803 family)